MSTPLMKQYAQLKAKYSDAILLFRLGDFYETFEEDARITSKVLGITLTRRGNGAAGDVPLAGFPHHALDLYLPKLLKAGYRVAVCEQLEDPKLAKGIVKRDVIEVVTPGVAFSDRVLDQKQNNYLACIVLPSAIAGGSDAAGVSFIDVSTAEFHAAEIPLAHVQEQIASLNPSEILVQKRDLAAIQDIVRPGFQGMFSKLEDWVFSHEYAYELLVTHFKTRTLKGYGVEDMKLGIVAAGAVMHYLQETQKDNLLHISKITPFDPRGYIVLDPATRRNLEISSSLSGSTEGTLFSVLDRTRTAMGGRMLKRWMLFPLNRCAEIQQRNQGVLDLVNNARMRSSLQDILQRVGDLERLNTRICTGRATPRDVWSLKFVLGDITRIIEILGGTAGRTLATLRDQLDPLPEVESHIASAMRADPPLALTDGGVIKDGFNAELDDLRSIALHGKEWIANLQRLERDRTGIPSLKVGFNNVFGYYIEITNTHKEKVPPKYIRKQTMTSAERFITPELKEFEDKILNAEEKILQLETRLFNELRLRITEHTATIQANATSLATLDCLTSFAEVAVENEYVLPEVNDSSVLEIREGRHPVIERLLPPGEKYTPNDVVLDPGEQQILIITGPNMSGKSSYLRMTGLIVLLAQIGSFVPAKKAVVGIADRIYTRVGASDNISSGESTFLVEMHEAAHIVNTASRRSLILLDEVGRGTSTFDGISIAWALTEFLHERIGARTLFATHYHEMNELADLFPRIKNYKVDVREYGDKVVFLHKVTPGFADHSYGIHVAKMAGLPDEVTERATRILHSLESSGLTVGGNGATEHRSGRIRASDLQLTLFEVKDDDLRTALQALDVNSLTPMEALQKLAELKQKLTS